MTNSPATQRPRRSGRIVLLSLAILMVAAVGAVALISGVQLRRSYLAPWSPSYATGYQDPRLQVSAAALLAGSSHNTQPWLIELDSRNTDTFDLYANPERLTPAVDPEGRQTMVSQGTFLSYLRTYAAAQGLAAQIELFPDGEIDEGDFAASLGQVPIARITLSTVAGAPSPETVQLAEAIYVPDTNRSPYLLTAVEPSVVSAVEGLTTPTTTVTIRQDPQEVSRLQEIAKAAGDVEASNVAAMDEASALMRPNEYQKNQHRWGFSVDGQAANPLMHHILQTALTLVPGLNQGDSAAATYRESTVAHAEGTSAFVLITTHANDRKSQVEAGMAYADVVLTASANHLATHPMSQAIQEYPEMAAHFQDIHNEFGHGDTIQMIARIGQPTREALPSLRMSVEDLQRNI